MTGLVLTILMLCFLAITIQDLRERQVYWFLFPICAICCCILFFQVAAFPVFLTAIAANLIFITLLLLILYGYSRGISKIRFHRAIGLGDILLFYALAFSFSTLAFIYIFVGSLIFALVIHLITKKHFKEQTIPLAGYLSLFFAATFMIAYKTDFINYLYVY